MNLVTNGMLMASAASLTLGTLHLRMCFARRDRLAHLLFVCAAFSLAAYGLIERAMMFAATPAEYGELARWAHLPAWLVIISIPWFVNAYLQAGRPWLLWSIVACRTLALVVNFNSAINLNYLEISSIKQIKFLGESLSIATGVRNPWTILGQVSLLLFMIYSIDAVIYIWRRGGQRRAITIGASIAVFAISIFTTAVLVLWGFVQLPLFASPFFLCIVAAMGYELTRDVQRAAELADDLRERDAELRESLGQLNLSAGAADVGIWTRIIGDNTIWASEKWHELFEFEPSQSITFDDYLHRIHADDRGRVEAALKAAETGEEYETEHRIFRRNGGTRWIGSRGKIDLVDGQPVRLRGASVDITKRKLAEEAAHDLSRKLIGAQEKERARIARELHDDLSQSVALLSMRLDGLTLKPNEPESVEKQVADLKSNIQKLSSDLHRIAHELHPAKLEQLGLESALRGFCREIAAAHGLRIEFAAANLPRSLPDDISLCLYRVTQESLQNIVKHSAASSAIVNIGVQNAEIRLTVKDNGKGFDPKAKASKESLGLISLSERIRAVNGTIKVASTVGSGTGTEIIARVPYWVEIAA